MAVNKNIGLGKKKTSPNRILLNGTSLKMSRKKLINLGFGDERRDINVSYYYYNFSLTLVLWIQRLIWSLSESLGLSISTDTADADGSSEVLWDGGDLTGLRGPACPFGVRQGLESWHHRQATAILTGRVLVLQGASSCSRPTISRSCAYPRHRILGCPSCV